MVNSQIGVSLYQDELWALVHSGWNIPMSSECSIFDTLSTLRTPYHVIWLSSSSACSAMPCSQISRTNILRPISVLAGLRDVEIIMDFLSVQVCNYSYNLRKANNYTLNEDRSVCPMRRLEVNGTVYWIIPIGLTIPGRHSYSRNTTEILSHITSMKMNYCCRFQSS